MLNEIRAGGAAAELFEAEEGRMSASAWPPTTPPTPAPASPPGSPATAVDRMFVDVGEAGTYDLLMRYSNGPSPDSGEKQLRLYVNGERAEQQRLPRP